MVLEDWEIIIISVCLSAFFSGLTAYTITWYFRHRVKPKSELLFEKNHIDTMEMIFGSLHWFDYNFKIFYETIEKEMGDLTDEKKEIIPTPKFVPIDQLESGYEVVDFGESFKKSKIFVQVKENLKLQIENMKSISETFSKENSIFMNYVHSSFLRNILHYYWTSLYYADWTLGNAPIQSSLEKRKELAQKIIEYVQKDDLINTYSKMIKEFIDKWEKRLEELEQSNPENS